MTNHDRYAFTDGEAADTLERLLLNNPIKGLPNVLAEIERAVYVLRNPRGKFDGFIKGRESMPLRQPNGRNDHGDLSLIPRG